MVTLFSHPDSRALFSVTIVARDNGVYAMNYFRDELVAKAGIAWPVIPTGAAFDLNNDLFLDRDNVIRPRHEWQGPEIRVAEYPSVVAACHVALDNYNRAIGVYVD